MGFVGAGAVTQSMHLPALASLPTKFRVRHVVDAAGSVSAAVADRFGARHGTDVQALLDDPVVDIVVVATPDATHPRIAIDACRAGKRAVLVEKPLALTPGEALAVAEASLATGVPVLVGTMHAHDPAFAAALPFVGDAKAVTIETIFGPNDAAVVDATELVSGSVDVSDAVAQMMGVAAPIQIAGADAPADWFVGSLMLLGLSTHDLALLRAAHGEPTDVYSAQVLVGGGLQFVLGYETGLTATLLAYPTQTKFNSWRARWLSSDRVVDLSFPVSYSSAAGSTLEVHERADRFVRTQRWDGRNETSLRHQWLHLHAVAHGDVEPSPSVHDAAADVALAQRIARVGAGAGATVPTPDPRQVALTAAGWVAAVHAPIVAGLGHEVRAVASRTIRSAERIAWPHSAAASTVEDLDLDAIDTVIVAGPPATHAAQALAALEAGKTVLVEKPIATRLDDADRMVLAGGRVGYLENWAFAPLVRASVDAVRRGDVGELRRVEVRCLHSTPGWGDHLNPEWGGGCVNDLGPHPIWWALALLGEPVTAVRAELSADDTGGRLDLRTASGIDATVEVTWHQKPGDMLVDAVAVGDQSTLRAQLDPRASLALEPGGPLDHAEPGPSRIAGFLRKPGYVEQLRAFLSDDWQGLPDARVGRDVLEIISAAYTSDGQGGGWIDLPFTGPRNLTPYQLRRLDPPAAADHVS